MDIKGLVKAFSSSDCHIFLKSCALNLAVDGSKDSMIHSLKNGQPSEGSAQLQAHLSVLDEHSIPNLFQVITGSDVNEANMKTLLTQMMATTLI